MSQNFIFYVHYVYPCWLCIRLCCRWKFILPVAKDIDTENPDSKKQKNTYRRPKTQTQAHTETYAVHFVPRSTDFARKWARRITWNRDTSERTLYESALGMRVCERGVWESALGMRECYRVVWECALFMRECSCIELGLFCKRAL